jgi:hypothetical protein
MLDDLFLIHERVSPRYLGLSERTIFVVYGVIAVALYLRHRQIICRGKYELLLLSVGFFAVAIAADMARGLGLLSLLGVRSRNMQYLLEDGFKLLGITGWFGYFRWVCRASISEMVATEYNGT